MRVLRNLSGVFSLIMVFVFITALASAACAESSAIKEDVSKVISATDLTQKMVAPAQQVSETAATEASTEVLSVNDANEEPVKPESSATQEEWGAYFKEMISYIDNNFTDPAAKALAYKNLLATLTDVVNSGVQLSKSDNTAILQAVNQFVGSDAFKNLDCSKAEVKATVTDLMSALVKSVATLTDKQAGNLDKTVLSASLTVIESFLGTTGYEMGKQFALLDKSQKETLINAFVDLAKKTVNNSAIDADTRVNVANNVSRLIVAQMKELYRNKDYSIDIKTATKEVVDMLNTFGIAESYAELSEGQKAAFIDTTTILAVELFWRSEFNNANKEFVSKFTAIFKNTIETGSESTKATAVNYLMHLFRSCNWGNKEVAAQLVKESLDVEGGLEGLADNLLSAMDDSELSAEQKANVTAALLNLVTHKNDIKAAGGVNLSDSTITELVAKSTEFIEGINDGSIEVSIWTKNNLISMGGLALNRLVSEGLHKTTENAALLDAYLEFAQDSLLTEGEDVGATHIQVNTINNLVWLKSTAEAKNDTALSGEIRDIVLNSDFDAENFVGRVQELVSGLTGHQADSGAWFCTAITNLAKIYLKEGDKASDNYVYLKNNVGEILDMVQAWMSDKNNLNDMRLMEWQHWLYEILSDLAKEAYKEDSVFEDSDLESFSGSFKEIFKTISGLKDTKVKEGATNFAKSLVQHLKDNDLEDYVTKLGLGEYDS